MNISISKYRIDKFLHSIVTQFKYDFKEENPQNYIYEYQGSKCSIQYVKKKKFLTSVYHFTLTIIKPISTRNISTKEASYNFQKNCWYGKRDSSFGEICNQMFQSSDWRLLDFESLSIQQYQDKFIFKMILLPGSYTLIAFPPLSQGIPIYSKEIKLLENMIEFVTKQFCLLEIAMERGEYYA